MAEAEAPERVIFFDGECSLCSGWVDFVMKRDPAARFRFASLQSETAREYLPPELTDEGKLDTVVLWQSDGTILLRSTAALEVVGQLPFPWPLCRLFKWVPTFIRDAVYRQISKNRYEWFGKRDSCRIPTPEERARFL